MKGMVTVELGNLSGVPQHLASGFLYGIPIKQNQVPDHFYTDMGFNYGRSGGGSQPEPARGWVYGREEFIVGLIYSPVHTSANSLFGHTVESICCSCLLLQDRPQI